MIGGDPAPHREPEGNERWMLLGAFFLAVVALAAIILEDYQPAKLAPLFVILAWFPLIALHEAGHALAAWLLGWKVEEVVVGFGRPALVFSIRGVPVTVKMYPLAGYVRPHPQDLRAVRLKSALVYLAGPGVELGLVLALTLAVGLDRMLARTDDVAVLAAQAVCVAALFGALGNLVPRVADTERGASFTDGLGVIMSLVRPRLDFARQVRAFHEERIERAAELGDVAAAVEACEAAHRALPGDPHLRSGMRLALSRLARGGDRAALRAALEGRALPDGLLP